MNIKIPHIIIPVIFVTILFVLCSSASVPVTQKQIIEINLSDPVPCSFEIHNPTDNVMLFTVKATEQYFNPQKINYTLLENWEDRTAKHTGWQRANWLVMPDQVTVDPHIAKQVEFFIIPQSTGTFWGKFEVMDVTPQSNMMAVKMCYVSQVIGYIYDTPAEAFSDVNNVSSDVDAKPCYIAYIIAFSMVFIIILLFMVCRWKKNTMIQDYQSRKKQ